MSNLMIDDESSRLKHFIWEELDEQFFLAVIFRSGRRYIVQRYFEQQLFNIKSLKNQTKWRHCLFEVISKTLLPIYLTRNEIELMHEIFFWHLNYPQNSIKLREKIDYMIDFEDLIDCFHSISFDNINNNNEKTFLTQPVTTLDAARKNIEMWKNLQENFIEKNTNQTIDKQVTSSKILIEFFELEPDRFPYALSSVLSTYVRQIKLPEIRILGILFTRLYGNYLRANDGSFSYQSSFCLNYECCFFLSDLISNESSLPSDQSSLSIAGGWLQLDSKIVPFIKKHCDRLLPVEYLLKEHVISSSEDFSLRSLYIPINVDDIKILRNLIHQLSSSSSNLIINNQTLLITLDHLIFRLKRLFFIRFLSSPINIDQIDYNKIMSFNGGLLTLLNLNKQHIPFIYINKQIYIPQINEINSFKGVSTFCMANKYELEYIRLISLYDYLSSDENYDNYINLLSINNLTLIPIDFYYEKKNFTIISFNDFHYHEYQRRTQQQQTNLIYYNNDDDYQQSTSLNGWWQPPVSSSSSKQKRPLSHFKLQRPIFF